MSTDPIGAEEAGIDDIGDELAAQCPECKTWHEPEMLAQGCPECALNAEEEEEEDQEELGEARPIPPELALTGHRIVVKGSRLLVRMIPKGERKTPGGILIPGDDDSELQECVIVTVGEGRYNQELGRFVGSNFTAGQVGWMNQTAPHLMTPVPGRKGFMLIQEDLVQAVLEETSVSSFLGGNMAGDGGEPLEPGTQGETDAEDQEEGRGEDLDRSAGPGVSGSAEEGEGSEPQ